LRYNNGQVKILELVKKFKLNLKEREREREVGLRNIHKKCEQFMIFCHRLKYLTFFSHNIHMCSQIFHKYVVYLIIKYTN